MLFSTAVNAELVTRPVILGILFLTAANSDLVAIQPTFDISSDKFIISVVLTKLSVNLIYLYQM